MIRSISLKDKTNEEIIDFVMKASPFSEFPSNLKEKVEFILRKPTNYHIQRLGERLDLVKSEKYFMIWRNLPKNLLFAGVGYVTDKEATFGINFTRFEKFDK